MQNRYLNSTPSEAGYLVSSVTSLLHLILDTVSHLRKIKPQMGSSHRLRKKETTPGFLSLQLG